MAAKPRTECSDEELMRYVDLYFATVELMNEALGKYTVLANDAITVSARSLFRARALEAQRDLELLKNKRRAFLNEDAAIKPPGEATVAEAIKRTTELAKLLATEANASAILNLATKGIAAFNRIQAA